VDIDLVSEKVIGCAYNVANQLGAGFVEKVYENAMMIELAKHNLYAQQQSPITVFYDDKLVGDFVADIIVEKELIVELKVAKNLDSSHHAQLMNYLKASKKEVGLLINFGSSTVEVKRMVNNYKGNFKRQTSN